MQVIVDTNMESSVKNLFAAGDGAGLSRDHCKCCGPQVWIAGRGILKKGINPSY